MNFPKTGTLLERSFLVSSELVFFLSVFFFDFSARGGVIAAKACNNREKFTVADVTERERNNGLVKGKRGYTFTEAIYGLSRQRGE